MMHGNTIGDIMLGLIAAEQPFNAPFHSYIVHDAPRTVAGMMPDPIAREGVGYFVFINGNMPADGTGLDNVISFEFFKDQLYVALRASAPEEVTDEEVDEIFNEKLMGPLMGGVPEGTMVC